MIVADVDWRPMYVAWDKVAVVYTTHWSATGAVILMENGGEAYTAWCPQAVMIAAQVYDEEKAEAWLAALRAAEAMWPARTEGGS